MSVISAAFMAFCLLSAICIKSREISTYRKILLVGKDEKEGISKLILVQHTLKFLAGFNNTVAIVAINNEDDTLGVLEVVSPQWPDFILPANIPYGELDVLVLDGLDVESCFTPSSSARDSWKIQVSTQHLPMVGIVVTISPSFSLYRIVVFPAASRPTIRIRISFFPHSLSKSFEKVRPIVICG